jgi:beta-glucosidase
MAKRSSGDTEGTSIWRNPDEDIDKRVDDLVGKLTLEEKVSQMVYTAAAIPLLGIPEYNWWNECLHGVARAGIATVFPQSIGMAASFDTDLMHKVATAISDEARAKHHESSRLGDRRIYKGLTYWSPNVNIFRDPRWGRGQETYGEDPYLTGRMGVAFVKGLQGGDPKYLKLVATPKHYAVHSGPEAFRHHFDAIVSKKDLRETYLPHFRECVKEARCASIMGAYNRINGEPCCASKTLLQNILRNEWGFDGYVVSDCGAIQDIHQNHTVTSTPEQSAALAVNNGCDLNCGQVFTSLLGAVKQGLISEATVDRAVKRLMKARMRLGMFDPPERVPYAKIPIEVVECEKHLELALQMARESIVLLKNEGELLPLKKDLKAAAVIGPNADDRRALLGNYSGLPSRYVTLLEGVRETVASSTEVIYARGCDLVAREETHWGEKADDGFAEAFSAVDRADVIVMGLGLTADFEGEERSAKISQWMGDRISIGLPDIQQRLLEEVCARAKQQRKPVVLVLMSGSPLAIPWAQKSVQAILQAWYPGAQGGQAIADVLFGDYSPSGRLPITFVESLDQLPPYTDYSMRGRTYRYMEGEPLYPFGYGLSYTSFQYSDLELSSRELKSYSSDEGPNGESLEVSATVKNTGRSGGDEVVQIYLSALTAPVEAPKCQLQGFLRVHLKPGESRKVSFRLTVRQLAIIDEEGRCVLEPGTYRIALGGRQPDTRSEQLTGTSVLESEFQITGERRVIR